jgi:hypothetical protein
MNETQTGVQFVGGDGQSVQIDAVNDHGQRCRGTLGIPGTHKNAVVYKLECTLCGFVYGSNSGDVHERRCPNCQDGAPGIRFWLIARKVPAGAPGANGGLKETRVERVAVETGADWIERHAGSMKDVPDAVYEEFLEYCRQAREGDQSLADADEP